MSFFTGTKGTTKQLPLYSQGQNDFLSKFLEMFGQGGAGGGFGDAMEHLRGLLSGSPESFAAFEAPLQRQFAEKTIPQLQERLTAAGAGGGRSSGAAQVLGGAATDFNERLAGQRAGLQQNAIQQLLSTFLQGSQIGLGARPFENMYIPGQKGMFQQGAETLGQILPFLLML
jgi:hypothetical protein